MWPPMARYLVSATTNSRQRKAMQRVAATRTDGRNGATSLQDDSTKMQKMSPQKGRHGICGEHRLTEM